VIRENASIELRQRDDRRLVVAAMELMEDRVAIGPL
jgi:hypothetical protein